MLPEVVDRLPAAVATHVARGENWAVLDFNTWAMGDFNAGVYPERRVFRRLFSQVCGWLPPGTATLIIVEKASWLAPKATESHACGEP